MSVASGYTPAALSTYTIISSTGALSGTFNGLANSSVFKSSTGQYFLITYTANSVVLTDEGAPTVTTNPTAQSVNAGQSVTFSAAATSAVPETVQWYVNTGSGSYSPIGSASSISSGATASYTFTASAGQNGYVYEAVFTGAGSTSTSTATLTVDSVITQPISTAGSALAKRDFHGGDFRRFGRYGPVVCKQRQRLYQPFYR